MSEVLVTGGLGFVGSNLVDRLLKDGHKVYVIDNMSTGNINNQNGDAHYVFADIRDINNVSQLTHKKFDCIFHTAALARIQPSFKNPVESCSVNFMGTVQLLEYARGMGSKFIYAGSSSATGDANINPYSASKFYGEQAVEMFTKSFGVNTAIARFFNVYGPRNVQDEVMGNLLGILQKQYLNDIPFTLIEDCADKRRDFTHVDDICEGLIRMWKTPEVTNCKIINLGRGDNLSVYEVAQAFIDNAKKKIEVNYLPKRKGELESTLADLSETKRLLGFSPKNNMLDYIKDWVREVDEK